jgi:hypothetical protein
VFQLLAKRFEAGLQLVANLENAGRDAITEIARDGHRVQASAEDGVAMRAKKSGGVECLGACVRFDG